VSSSAMAGGSSATGRRSYGGRFGGCWGSRPLVHADAGLQRTSVSGSPARSGARPRRGCPDQVRA
jgi:hypothetical protein